MSWASPSCLHARKRNSAPPCSHAPAFSSEATWRRARPRSNAYPPSPICHGGCGPRLEVAVQPCARVPMHLIRTVSEGERDERYGHTPQRTHTDRHTAEVSTITTSLQVYHTYSVSCLIGICGGVRYTRAHLACRIVPNNPPHYFPAFCPTPPSPIVSWHHISFFLCAGGEESSGSGSTKNV